MVLLHVARRPSPFRATLATCHLLRDPSSTGVRRAYFVHLVYTCFLQTAVMKLDLPVKTEGSILKARLNCELKLH